MGFLDNISSGQAGLIGGAIAIAVLTYVSARARNHGQEGVLRFGYFIVGFAWLLVLGVLGLIYVFLFVERPLALILLIVGFGAAAIYMLGDAHRTYGYFDDERIYFKSLWTGEKNPRWDELKSVEFKHVCQWYELTFKKGEIIRLSNLMQGHGAVLEWARKLGIRIENDPNAA